MLFITALFTTLGAAYLFEKLALYSQEVAIGCLSIALIALVTTLVVAPWQFQLLLLVGLLSYRLSNTRAVN